MTQSNEHRPVRESSTPPLLASMIRQLSPRTILGFLATGSPAMLRAGAEWLIRQPVEEVTSILEQGLETDDRTIVGVLQVLKHPDLEPTERIFQRLIALLSHSTDSVRRAAVAVIARRWPHETHRVLSVPVCRQDHESLRIVCQTDDVNLILQLLDAFGFPQRTPPPTIGFLVTATWLAENHSSDTAAVEWLIHECGYCDDPITTDVIEMLSLGFPFVVSQMKANGPADKWRERMRTLAWRLVPDASDSACRDRVPLDLNDPIDTALFLSAVRETDRLRFESDRLNPPRTSPHHSAEPTPVCFHASARHLRRTLLTEAYAIARELAVPDDQLGEFVLDHAGCVLETVAEQKLLADRRLRTRWQLRQSGGTIPPRQRVIGRFVPSPPDTRLSPCAQSVCRLAELAGLNAVKLARWLGESEKRWSRLVVPIGIELQIPRVEPNLFGAWKDALPFLGIPSPHRPEFGGMVEAAFRPARSFHAILLAPVLLHRLGLISRSQPQDITLHISMQGDLNDQARYLAFPQLFIHPSQRQQNRPANTMTRVMSKGFVHRNREIERLDHAGSDLTEPVRTELRMFRVFCDEAERHTVVALTYIDDVISTHLMGSAMLGPCHQCRDLAAEYGRSLAADVAKLPPEFSQLLQSNFYESTGDPRDVELLQQLPMFRTWSAVRRIVRDRNQRAELDEHFRFFRSQHVQSLQNHFSSDHGIDWPQETAAWTEWICLASNDFGKP